MKMNIICLGDSLTAGLDCRQEDLWTEILNERSRNHYINKGIAGDTTGGMLSRLYRDAIQPEGKIVILMGGGNDFMMENTVEAVQANMMAMVHQVYFYQKVPVIGVPMLLDEGNIREDWRNFTDFKTVNEKMRKYRQWIYRFSRTFHTEILDFYKVFESLNKDDYENYFSDGVHPNRKGNTLMAELILGLGM